METKGHAVHLFSEQVLWLLGKPALKDVRNRDKPALNK